MGTAEARFAFVLFAVVLVLRADMLKVVDATHHHFATSGGAVMLEHVVERIEENFKVGVGETGAFGKSRRDVNLGNVEGVGDNVLPMVRSLSASSPLVTAQRVIEISIGVMGWYDWPKVNCTGPRTWPQAEPFMMSSPVESTPPKVRTSKNSRHSHFMAASCFSELEASEAKRSPLSLMPLAISLLSTAPCFISRLVTTQVMADRIYRMNRICARRFPVTYSYSNS